MFKIIVLRNLITIFLIICSILRFIKLNLYILILILKLLVLKAAKTVKLENSVWRIRGREECLLTLMEFVRTFALKDIVVIQELT